MKNKKLLIIGAVVLAVLIIGGVVLATRGKDDNKSASNTPEQIQNSSEFTSINGLLAKNQNLTCTYDYTDESGNKSSGTVYIAGQRMRGYFTINTEQGEQKSNILTTSDTQYVWQDGTGTGFKISLSAANAQQPQQSEGQQSVDQDKDYEFDCNEWSVDEAVFTVPTDVQFTDFSAQAQQLQQTTQQACASIADETARAACENAL